MKYPYAQSDDYRLEDREKDYFQANKKAHGGMSASAAVIVRYMVQDTEEQTTRAAFLRRLE